MEQEQVRMKPHHFLDILRSFGVGKLKYEPSPKGDAQYIVADKLLKNRDIMLKFTAGCDDICAPCSYNKKGKCANKVSNHGHYTSMHEYNRDLDTGIYRWLGLKEGAQMTASAYCRLVREKINDIKNIWIEVPEEENAVRRQNLLKGITFYLGE